MRSYPNLSPTPSSLQSSSTPEPQPRFRNVDELVRAAQEEWLREFEEKKAKWERMTHEQRVAYIKAVFDRFLQKAAQNPQQTAAEFLQWLISPEGALAWPYIWKPEYRELAIKITSRAYQLALKYLGPRG